MAPRPTDRSSGRLQPTPTSAEEYALSGRSDPPDPAFNAYRKDLADIALAGTVVASHYARPLAKVIGKAGPLRSAPSDDAPVLGELAAGDDFQMLDESIGWAWGYAGEERRVGYVRSEVLG